jgi:hypothetical protein
VRVVAEFAQAQQVQRAGLEYPAEQPDGRLTGHCISLPGFHMLRCQD